jgi:hypothetical protein
MNASVNLTLDEKHWHLATVDASPSKDIASFLSPFSPVPAEPCPLPGALTMRLLSGGDRADPRGLSAGTTAVQREPPSAIRFIDGPVGQLAGPRIHLLLVNRGVRLPPQDRRSRDEVSATRARSSSRVRGRPLHACCRHSRTTLETGFRRLVSLDMFQSTQNGGAFSRVDAPRFHTFSTAVDDRLQHTAPFPDLIGLFVHQRRMTGCTHSHAPQLCRACRPRATHRPLVPRRARKRTQNAGAFLSYCSSLLGAGHDCSELRRRARRSSERGAAHPARAQRSCCCDRPSCSKPQGKAL